MSKPKEKPVAAVASAGDEEKSSLYVRRLQDAGLPIKPVATTRQPPRQFQIALVAAMLGQKSDETSTKLAARAVDIWNASGAAVLVETQAERLAKGALLYNKDDWEANALCLVAMLDTNHGGVPGQKAPDEAQKIYLQARVDAAKAVRRLWGHGPDNDGVLAGLFAAESETEKTRRAKFVELLQLAHAACQKSERLMLGAKSPDRLREAIRSAWSPLGECDATALDTAVAQAKCLIGTPETALFEKRLGGNPLVVRWLAMVRSEQLATRKKRSSA